ncbi:hypothetical protein BBJ28_00001879 [Nothophytophthora sp. Chile5]|nr:hypothetical protein BBJ28_00001879 [Nothophytophthora sp. Chile5]
MTRLQASPSPPAEVLKRYASTRKFGRRHELQREQEHLHNTAIVVFSKRNPDEEDTVMDAQVPSHELEGALWSIPCLTPMVVCRKWRIQEAVAREKSLPRRLAALVGRVLGPTLSYEPTVILDHVLLGSRENAADSAQLYNAGVTHICNCAKQVANSFEGEYIYLKLNLHDSLDEELLPHFQTVSKFLKRVERLQGRALIHCISGMSPALLIAYLMIDKKMPLLQAYNMVRRKRRLVQPNQAFRLQLAKYELMLFGSSSVATTSDKDWNFFAWNEVKVAKGLRR